jgi:hypothetical protein
MALNPLAVRDGNSTVRSVLAFQDASGNLVPAHTLDSAKPTYRFAATFTPYATGPVTLVQIKGSATKTVRVKRIRVGGVSTANASVICKLQRTSSTGTGGTGVAPTAAKNDTSSAAATAVVTHFTTASQSSGTAVGGPLSVHRLYTGVVTTPTLGQDFMDVYPENGQGGQALVVRGAADFLEYQLTTGNLSAGTVLEYVVELEEDDS